MLTKHHIDRRFIALFMAVVMLLTSMRVLAFVLPVAAYEGDIKIRDDAMHFLIRHWHMTYDSDATLQGGQYDKEAGEFFVIAEGYIMPSDNDNGYVCCTVSQDGSNNLQWIEDVQESLYIDRFEASSGELYLNKKVITDDETGEILEDYTGLSVSAGHSAIKEEDNNIVISYQSDVHLAKAHVFYNPTGKKVRGVSKDEWKYFVSTNLYGDTNNEVDTIWVYTYINDDDNGNKAGDLVLIDGKVIEAGDLSEDKNGNVLYKDGTVHNDIDMNNIQLTKFYSSAEGLHTDNTVIAVGSDGRTFTVDLEAWYNEGYAPQIGFALDASGSMAFALNDPSPITVDKTFITTNSIKVVESNPNDNSGWDSYFLTDEQLKKILNPHNTDNSALSASGYSYFVQNDSSYEPLGYWEGLLTPSALLSFNKGEYQDNQRDWLLDSITGKQAKKVKSINNLNNFVFNDYGEITDWPSNPDYKFSSNYGFELLASNDGIMLDVSPTSGNFTVSFKMKVANDPSSSSRNLAELLYIGPSSSGGAGGFYTLYRDAGGSSNRLRGNQQAGSGTNVTDINSIFQQGDKTYTVTLVFENADKSGGTVSAYINGEIGSGANNTPNIQNNSGTPNEKEMLYTPFSLNDLCIVLNGVQDSYDGSEIYIDEFAMYDLALTSNQVKTLVNSSGIPNVAKTGNGDILGSINITEGKTTQPATLHHTQAGWYHISHAGEYLEHYLDIGTGKRLFGIAGQGRSLSAKDVSAGYTYEPSEDTPTRFYVVYEKGEYRLCCFYGANVLTMNSSYVYELADGDYIRTEGLQRILGSFTNKLNEQSPSAKVSAVRYSSSSTNLPLDELVLLDWTNDPKEMANMMSLNRGDGTAKGYTTSANGVKQYNYGLTGSTDTAKGLQSYYDNLFAENEKDNKNNPYKYFIIFTDGANTGSVEDAVKYANLLKEAGYIIYAVALIEDPNSSDYKTAEDFLSQLIGSKNNSNPNDYLFFADDMTGLTNKFQTILKAISVDLSGYTITNYIDPRFDLVGKDGNVWHLNANGQVEVVDKNSGIVVATYDVTKETVEFSLSGNTTIDARSPVLKFDSAKDKNMYYLEWTDQTIPTSPENAETMVVWNAEYDIRAKDDFIGGNAILTNGNKDNMNWVRFPGQGSAGEEDYIPPDSDATSGTDDIKRDKDNGDLYPSKGFPRTAVNVKLLPLKTNPLDAVSYMGEAISPRQILTEIKDNYMTETYYLEYLKRYAYQRYDRMSYDTGAKKDMDRPLLDLLTEWLEWDNEENSIKAFSVPYMYLPSVEWDENSGKILLDKNGKATTVYNNTGDPATNELDVVGVLTFRWEQLDPKPNYDYEPTKDAVKTDTEQVKYSLTVEFTPLRVGDSYELFYGNKSYSNASRSKVIATTAEGYPIVSVAGADGPDDGIITYAETGKGPFEAYLQINAEHKGIVDNQTRLDREKYINGNAQADHRGNYTLISDTDFKWDNRYQPETGKEELIDTKEDSSNYPYGNASLINNYGTDDEPNFRTLKAISSYTADVIGGGIALEVKMLIGEIKKVADTNGDFKKSFTLPATRSFQDTQIVEELKKNKYTGKDENHPKWEDFGEKFNITFSFDYTKAQIEALEQNEEGYVTIYAKTTKIEAPDNNFNVVNGKKAYSDKELPIGTYEFALNDINNVLNGMKIHSAIVEANEDKKNFNVKYYDDYVLNGLNTLHEGDDPVYRDENNKTPEIQNSNIGDFLAGADTEADKKTVTFYIGTVERALNVSKDDYVAVRGKVGADLDDKGSYIYDRLGILRLSTGLTRLTIEEKGGQSNESFLYRIKGKTLGEKDVDLIVSVKGEGLTTIEILPGEYTVEEISDWSWRYINEKTVGHENDWEISANWKTAKNTFWYKNDEPIEDHKTVTYYHKRNDKVWLGGESSKDNHFK